MVVYSWRFSETNPLSQSRHPARFNFGSSSEGCVETPSLVPHVLTSDNTALDTLCSLDGEMRVVDLIPHTEQVKNLITEGFDIEVTSSGSHIHARHSAV